MTQHVSVFVGRGGGGLKTFFNIFSVTLIFKKVGAEAPPYPLPAGPVL